MSGPQLETTLPNGQIVSCLDKREALLVYGQVRQYFDHGIKLQAGSTIFDVGANIGLFSLLANEMCDGDVKIYAFEPIPATYAVLSANMEKYTSGQAEAIRCGLAAEPGNTTFAYYPHHSVLSTAHYDQDNEDEMRSQLKESLLRNLRATPFPLNLLRFLPSAMRAFVIEKLTDKTFDEAEQINCELITLSAVIDQYGVEQIDLLKVDAEKSELEVLEGIEVKDWHKIQQVVMEVHDLGDRLKSVKQLLHDNGIVHIHVEQEPVMRGSNVYALFASRQALVLNN